MNLSSGRVITDEVLREIADWWVQSSLLEEHADDYIPEIEATLMDGGFDNIEYTEEDAHQIVQALIDIVIDTEIELKDAYAKIYQKHLASKEF